MKLVSRLNVFSETAEVTNDWRYNSTSRISLQAGAALPFIPFTTKGHNNSAQGSVVDPWLVPSPGKKGE